MSIQFSGELLDIFCGLVSGSQWIVQIPVRDPVIINLDSPVQFLNLSEYVAIPPVHSGDIVHILVLPLLPVVLTTVEFSWGFDSEPVGCAVVSHVVRLSVLGQFRQFEQ